MTSAHDYPVPWANLSFVDRLQCAAGRWQLSTPRGVACALMTRRQARQRLGLEGAERIRRLLAGAPNLNLPSAEVATSAEFNEE